MWHSSPKWDLPRVPPLLGASQTPSTHSSPDSLLEGRVRIREGILGKVGIGLARGPPGFAPLRVKPFDLVRIEAASRQPRADPAHARPADKSSFFEDKPPATIPTCFCHARRATRLHLHSHHPIMIPGLPSTRNSRYRHVNYGPKNSGVVHARAHRACSHSFAGMFSGGGVF